MARLQAVVLGVAALAEGAAAAFEPERGRIEEGDADLAEQLATMSEQRLLDGLAARPAVLLLAEPGDGLAELAQREPLSAGDAAVPRPDLGMAIGPRDHEAVQHRGVDGALEVEGEAAPLCHAAQHGAAAGQFPEATEDEIRTDALAAQRCEPALVERGEDDGTAAMTGGGDGELVEQVLGLDLVAAAEGLDDALDVAAALADVLDQLDVVVAIDVLGAERHGAGLTPPGVAP